MEFFSAVWWSKLLAIILIDLVLAGDNAIVIALTARNLPAHLQKKAIIWGTAGAVVVRILMTIGVVWLLQVPGLMLVGGLGLVFIAWKLLADEGKEEAHGVAATSFWGAMKTIVIADALMGIDNVLAVAGAAHGSIDLVIIGLLVSVPIMVYGSTMVLKLVARFPIITFAGAGVLAFTAAKMIVNEPWHIKAFFATNPVLYWGVIVAIVVLVLLAGWWAQRRYAQVAAAKASATPSTPQV